MPDTDISLRPFCEADAEAITNLLLDEQVKQTYMLPDFPDRAAARPLFDRLLALSEEDSRFVRAICVERRAVGIINDVGIDGREVELGYALLPAVWGRGIATAALGLAIDRLFARGFDTVKAAAFETNSASLRVMEKAGMIPTGQTEEVAYRGQTHRCICCEKKKI
jgi:RimJ/RimL family protein N-acetyltransferase